MKVVTIMRNNATVILGITPRRHRETLEAASERAGSGGSARPSWEAALGHPLDRKPA